LREYFGDRGAAGARNVAHLVADDRASTLSVGGTVGQITAVRRLIRALDVAVDARYK
jgi:hypothetical protein